MKTNHKPRILISACLLGLACRFDGQTIPPKSELIALLPKGIPFPFCPEVAGGLPVPRPPAEISWGTGQDVLNNQAKVMNQQGQDVSKEFINGASLALQLVQKKRITLALLKEKSPSCGIHLIYDGTFSGQLHPGSGVTAALLKKHNVQVFSESDLGILKGYLQLL